MVTEQQAPSLKSETDREPVVLQAEADTEDKETTT